MSKITKRLYLAAAVQSGGIIACLAAALFPEDLNTCLSIAVSSLFLAGWLYHFERIERLEIRIEVPYEVLVPRELANECLDTPERIPLDPRLREHLGELGVLPRFHGRCGPWTTVDLINKAGGINAAENDNYSPEII